MEVKKKSNQNANWLRSWRLPSSSSLSFTLKRDKQHESVSRTVCFLETPISPTWMEYLLLFLFVNSFIFLTQEGFFNMPTIFRPPKEIPRRKIHFLNTLIRQMECHFKALLSCHATSAFVICKRYSFAHGEHVSEAPECQHSQNRMARGPSFHSL